MKRFLLTLGLIAGIGTAAMAQDSFFSVRAGANFADLYKNNNLYSECQTGFNAAALYNMPLMQGMPLYLQSGLSVEMKGARNSGLLAGVANTHLKSYALEVPVVVTYDVQVGAQSAIVPMLGVYYSFAFAGTLEGGDVSYHQFQKQTVTLPDGSTVKSRIMHQSDVGLRAGIGFLYNKCLIGVAYDAGMMNVFSKTFRDLGYEASTSTWSVNLEYRFN